MSLCPLCYMAGRDYLAGDHARRKLSLSRFVVAPTCQRPRWCPQAWCWRGGRVTAAWWRILFLPCFFLESMCMRHVMACTCWKIGGLSTFSPAASLLLPRFYRALRVLTFYLLFCARLNMSVGGCCCCWYIWQRDDLFCWTWLNTMAWTPYVYLALLVVVVGRDGKVMSVQTRGRWFFYFCYCYSLLPCWFGWFLFLPPPRDALRRKMYAFVFATFVFTFISHDEGDCKWKRCNVYFCSVGGRAA